MREAVNQQDILHLLRQEASLGCQRNFRTGGSTSHISWRFKGCSPIGDRQAFFIDIGGGSTEIALGGEQNYSLS
jgi:exopolyphosphatase/pppGpp-phosphohydrolase